MNRKPNYSSIVLFGLFLAFLSFQSAFSQECTSKVTIKLNNIRGGVFSNETVTLKNQKDGKTVSLKSNSKGEAIFMLPCDQKYSVTISNYTRTNEIISPAQEGAYATRNFSYEPNMAEKDAAFAMSENEKSTLDAAIKLLPDTTYVKGSIMTKPTALTNYITFTLKVTDLESVPLMNETVVFTGINRNKSIKGTTNTKGEILVYLPKGDTYTVNFKHNKDYNRHEVKYSKGNGTGSMNLMYLGTKEIEYRKKVEAERIAAEEKRLADEHKAFVDWCKRLKITEEEGHRRKLVESSGAGSDTVVLAALNRNKWSEKLIVCDLTGSMDPYANQLSVWYQLNYKKESNLQFVFFNDGDDKEDAKKVIGNTGGIYYQRAKGLDSLIFLMSKVRSRGNGGDCPENNMEALIKGVKTAGPYKELVMIVDNNAPVKDLSLLKSFNKPVHIILCGSNDGQVLLDYFLIAWKTKGSIHTIEEDIYSIANMSEGESVVVGGITYRIMGGEFVRVTKL
ncbi:MAG: hypothetical protein RI922_2305 [Bacteroidota bacterium]|jgi:hypothetical protein